MTAPRINRVPDTAAEGMYLINLGSCLDRRIAVMIAIMMTADHFAWGAAAVEEMTTEIGEPPNRAEHASASPE